MGKSITLEIFMTAFYVILFCHGLAAAFYPPLSVTPIIGENSWTWALATALGAVIGGAAHFLRYDGRLIEASGLCLAAYGLIVYESGVIGNFVFSDGLGRMAQIFQLAAFILLILATAVRLIVAYLKDRAVAREAAKIVTGDINK